MGLWPMPKCHLFPASLEASRKGRGGEKEGEAGDIDRDKQRGTETKGERQRDTEREGDKQRDTEKRGDLRERKNHRKVER